MRRVLFIWLPQWPIERLLLQARRRGEASPWPAEAPVGLSERAQNGLSLRACNARAAAAGVHPGQALADARALCPGLVCCAHDPEGETLALERLARWCGRWSPEVAPLAAGPGLALDIAGVEHLFGGETALLQDVAARLGRLGLTARLGLADSLGGAWALAQHGAKAVNRAAPKAGLAPLLGLPIAALRLEPGLQARLRALGLRRIGDLARLPRASLARRFGPALLERLDQAGACAGEPLAPLAPPLRLAAARRFAEPVLTLEGVGRVAAELCREVAGQLAAQDAGARRLALRLYRVDGERLQISIGAGRPQQEGARLARLFEERLAAMAERLDLGFGVDAAALLVLAFERLERRAQALSWTHPSPSPPVGEGGGPNPPGEGGLRSGLQVEATPLIRPCGPPSPTRGEGQRRDCHTPSPPVGELLGGKFSPSPLVGEGGGRSPLGEGCWSQVCGVEATPLIRPCGPPSPGQARGRLPSRGEGPASDLCDRLAARLGEGAVKRLGPQASHIPERAQRLLAREAAPGAFDAALGVHRPLLLLEPPEPIEAVAELPDAPPRLFRWRRVAHQVARAEGPERIAAEWWALSLDCIEPGRPRDYYRIETREGRRFWLYREGLYGEGAQAPRWFLHGAFG